MRTPATLVLSAALVLAAIAPGAPLRGEAQARHGADQFPLNETAPAIVPVDIRVNAGGPAYNDSQGNQWLADRAYTPGSWGCTAGESFSTTLSIGGTNDDPLYQSQRSNPGQYKFDLANGVYEVELRFAEVYCSSSSCRLFHVKIENEQFLTSFGPLNAAGFAQAVNTTFMIKVTDNQLVVDFVAITGSRQPVINAIRVSGGPDGIGRTTLRLNAGGYDYTDTQGNVWVADQKYALGARGYLGTQSQPYKINLPILNTDDQLLFQTNRYGMSGYAFDVENGPYRVNMLFAELYTSINAAGARVFDVWAEGAKVLPNVDVFSLSGNRYRAITQTFPINVLDGQLTITFTQKTPAQAPIVNAIAVLPLDSVAPGPWTNFAPTGWQTTLTPPVSVQVQDTLTGLDVASGQYAYSTNGGVAFSEWLPASVTGANGVTTSQVVLVSAVNFNQDSATQNRVKFRISDMGGNIGYSGVYTVPIDTLAPTSVITSPLSGSLVGGPAVTVRGSAGDAASGVQSVEVSTDGGASWNLAGGTASWAYTWPIVADGVFNLRSRARDNINRVETPGAGITVTVDSVSPVTFIHTPVSGQLITGTSQLITGTAFDATSGVRRVEVSLDGGSSWITATGTTTWSYNWTPAGQGAHTIRARAVDMAGNVDTPGTTVGVIVDRVAPASAITDPVAGRLIRGDLYTISGTAGDDAAGSGLSMVQVSTDGATWVAASGLSIWSYDWDLPGDGVYTVRSRAYDLAGNVQSPPASVTVYVDNAAPVSVSSLNGALGTDGWYVSPVTLSILASDASSGVRHIFYRVDDGEWITYTAAVHISILGSHSVSYYAVDNAGNTEAAHSVSLRIDTLAPTTTHSLAGTAGSAGWFRSAVLFSMLADDATSGVRTAYYSLDGGPWTAYGAPLVISADGVHDLQHYATDNAGNSETPHGVAIKVDAAPPVSTMTFPLAGQVISGAAVVLRGTATDGAGSGLQNVEVSINGGTWVPAQGGAAWTYPWTPPGPGQLNIRVRATDQAGNAENPGSGVYIVVDTTAPSSAILSPYSGQILRGPTAVITGTSSDTYSDVARVEVSTNGGASWATATLGAGGAWSFTWTITNDGIYNLRSRATDLAGNVETPGLAVSVQVDSIAPLSIIRTPDPGQTMRAEWLTISGTASDIGSGVKRVEISIDGGAWQLADGLATWSYLWAPIESDGAHTIRSRATDNAGNVETPGAGVSVVIDNGKPASTITNPANGQVITASTLAIAGVSSDAVTGVKRVEITLQRGADGFYWDGNNWTADEIWLATEGTAANWSYSLPDLPIVGMVTIVSRATDNVGNVEIPGPGVTVSIQRGYRVVMPLIIGEYAP